MPDNEIPRSKHYTESAGDGVWDVTVTLIEKPTHTKFGKQRVLCELRGCDVQHDKTADVPVMKFRTRKAGVTDFEHDSSSFALVEVSLPHVYWEYDDRRELVGIVEDVRLYPEGVDPLTQQDGDTRRNWCDLTADDGWEDHTPHPLAPYLPPEREELGKLINVPVKVFIRLRQDVRDFVYGKDD